MAQVSTLPSPLVERVGQTGFLQLEAESFNNLAPRQKALAFWLSMAAIAVDPIAYDQNSFYGLDLKHLLEQILTHSRGIEPVVLKKITDYTKLFWANHGNHNSFTSQKFLPEFTPEELKDAALQALENHASMDPLPRLEQELEDLRRPIFDGNYRPFLTAKNPKNGDDLLAASGNNLYDGVTMADLENFRDKYPLNSRLVMRNGSLTEEVYRAGGGPERTPAGLCAEELNRAIGYLDMAKPFADEQMKRVLEDLIRYYQTGDPVHWRQFNIDWVGNDSTVDFTNGFIEVYKDPRGVKGSMQACVVVVDQKMNKFMKELAANAKYFEQGAPYDDKYKLDAPHPTIVKAVEALIETADFDVNTVGENLPNEMEIHDEYGSKSLIFSGPMRALNAACGCKISNEFAYSEEERARAEKHQDIADELGTALHEVLGHGSGKMSPYLTEEPATYLREYGATVEEARADLVALWNFFDPKLQEFGAVPDIEIAKAAYDGEARASLVELHEFPTGDTIEQDHRRATQLIVNFIREKTGAIQPVERDGKIYLVVKDYDVMRGGVGMLLAELMRIKAEGEYDDAKTLISKYGIHFNTAWRDQVVQRYHSLDLPTYWYGINPDIVPGDSGGPTDYEIFYPRDIVKQQLRYSAIRRE